jgi:spore coat polysaccharide biosynthesis predicted glycosyltransferase SpsG
MNIVFRTRGNHKQGMGDLYGSLALYKEFERLGHKCIMQAEPDREAIEFFNDNEIQYIAADNTLNDIQAATGISNECIIFNMLKNDSNYVASYKEKFKYSVTIDDDGPAAQLADLRINPLYITDNAFCDLDLVFIKKEYAAYNIKEKVISDSVSNILITLGGADTYGFTPMALEGVLAADIDSVERVDVITGSAYQHIKELEDVINKSEKSVVLYRNVNDMPERLFNADLVVCSAGLTIYEAACCGAPVVIICNEPFEVQTANRFENENYGSNLGFGEQLSYFDIKEGVLKLSDNKTMREEMSLRGRKIVDGKGAEKTVGLILKGMAEK